MTISPLRLVTQPRLADGTHDWEDVVGLEPSPGRDAGRGRDGGRHRRIGRVLAVSDALAAVTSCVLTAAALLAFPALGGGATPAAHLAFLPVAGALVPVTLAFRGSYSSSRQRLAPAVADELLGLVGSVAGTGVLLLAGAALTGLAAWVPPAAVVVLMAVTALVLPACRTLALTVAAHDRSRVTRVIVVGSGKVAGELARRLDRSRLVDVVGTVDDEPVAGDDVLGRVDDLPRLCHALGAHRVVIAFSRRHPSRSAELVLALRDVVEVDVVVRYFELAGWESRLHDVAGLSLLNLGSRPGRWAAAAKRLLDVSVAGIALLLLAPLLAVIAAVVWVDSGGPVLFRQTRVGRGMRTFRIVKFRTMFADPADRTAGTEPVGLPITGRARPGRRPATGGPRERTPFDAPDAARVTGMGRLLRRTGLDELPQLLNVLRGDMSLVGPRPFVPEECGDLLGWAQRRFEVRPGITGMWQVCGQHDVSFDELCRLDVQYATSWSIRTDLRILARTPSRLLHGSAPGR